MDRNIVTLKDAQRVRAQLASDEAAAQPGERGALGKTNKGIKTDIKPDEWFQRLAKYIPAEALGLYLAIAGLVTAKDLTGVNGLIWLAATLAVCVIFNTLFLRLLWKVVRWSQIFVSDIALLVYAFATGGKLISQLPFYEPRLGTLVLVIATAFLAFFSPPANNAQLHAKLIANAKRRPTG